jgi:hypothetical protein
VVVSATTNGRIKTVDDIGTLHGSLLEVMRLAGLPRVSSDNVQRLVALVTGVSLGKTAGATTVATTAATCYGIV